jgi:hypothetical protein
MVKGMEHWIEAADYPSGMIVTILRIHSLSAVGEGSISVP